MCNRNVLESFNEALERAIGHKIGIKYIQTDKKGVLKYIPAGSLHRGKPLILSHYVGSLMVYLPYQDYRDLIKGKITPQRYIDQSIWHFGYFWGAANIKTGVFWETLENGKPGIHKTEKIQRYLAIMKCRIVQHHLGENTFDKAQCLRCKVMKCPMSPVPAKKAASDIEKEFGDHKMRRLEFFDAFAKHIMERYGFKLSALFMDEHIPMDVEEAYMAPGLCKKNVKMIISQEMYMDMMYNPQNYDVEEMLQRYKLIATTHLYDDKTGEISFGRTMEIKPEMTAADLNKFWHNM